MDGKISYKTSSHWEDNKTDSITIMDIILCIMALQVMGIKMVKHLSRSTYKTSTRNNMYPRYEDLDNSITIRRSVRKSRSSNVQVYFI